MNVKANRHDFGLLFFLSCERGGALAMPQDTLWSSAPDPSRAFGIQIWYRIQVLPLAPLVCPPRSAATSRNDGSVGRTRSVANPQHIVAPTRSTPSASHAPPQFVAYRRGEFKCVHRRILISEAATTFQPPIFQFFFGGLRPQYSIYGMSRARFSTYFGGKCKGDGVWSHSRQPLRCNECHKPLHHDVCKHPPRKHSFTHKRPPPTHLSKHFFSPSVVLGVGAHGNPLLATPRLPLLRSATVMFAPRAFVIAPNHCAVQRFACDLVVWLH